VSLVAVFAVVNQVFAVVIVAVFLTAFTVCAIQNHRRYLRGRCAPSFQRNIMELTDKQVAIAAAVTAVAKEKNIVVDESAISAFARVAESDFEDDNQGGVRPASGFHIRDYIDQVRQQYRWVFRSQSALDDFDKKRLERMSPAQRLDFANTRKK
jgi:pantothenate kinase type III